MNNLIKKAISDTLSDIKKTQKKTIRDMANMLEIPQPTFETYLYGKKSPTLDTLIQICNRLDYSINNMLNPLFAQTSDQKSIAQIRDDISKIPELKRSQLYQVLAPITESVIKSYPNLLMSDFGLRSRILRRDLQIGLEHMANLCGISVDSLKVYEASQQLPSIDIFLRFCVALGVSPEYMACKYITYNVPFDGKLYMLTPLQLEGLAGTIRQISLLIS